MTETPPADEPQFGVDGCTCRPWTRKYGTPRYCGPNETVTDIGGWERGRDCPHHAVASAPADRDLRDRIADTVRAFGFANYGLDSVDVALHDYPEDQEWVPALADAVLAVLPAPADRAAVLREAAETAYRIARRLDDQHHDERAQGAWDVENTLRAELRRMADEAQQLPAPEVFGPDVVAYRHPTKPRTYLCRQHGDGKPGLVPLASDDLPDGVLCDECGVDVLAQQAGEGR